MYRVFSTTYSGFDWSRTFKTFDEAKEECIERYIYWLTDFITDHNADLDNHGHLDLDSAGAMAFNDMIATNRAVIVDQDLNVMVLDDETLEEIDWCPYNKYRENHNMHLCREGDVIAIYHSDGTYDVLTVVEAKMEQTGIYFYKAIDLNDNARIPRSWEFSEATNNMMTFLSRGKGEFSI